MLIGLTAYGELKICETYKCLIGNVCKAVLETGPA